MVKTLRLGLLLLLCLTGLAAAQNRVFLTIEPASPDPSKPLIFKMGTTVHFTVRGFEYQASNLPPVEVPVVNVMWSVEPKYIGTITPDGDFTPMPHPSSPVLIQAGHVIVNGTVGTTTLTAIAPFMIDYDISGARDYTISGVVNDATGQPIAGARVSAYDPMIPTLVPIETTTDAHGAYSLRTMFGNFYVIADAQGFLAEYYDNAADQTTATRIQSDSTQPQRSGVDFVLAKAAGITGRVVNVKDSTPIIGVEVQAVLHSSQPNTMPVYSGKTDHNGVYSIEGMTPGSYILAAYAQGYATQYYDMKSNPRDADTVVVSANATIDHIDFMLSRDPIIHPATYLITGVVKDAAGAPVQGALIYAENMLPVPPVSRPFVARSAADGTYQLPVSGGSFIVRAEAQGFVTEYFDNTHDPALATQLQLDASHPRRDNVDFSLGTGGRISGRVVRVRDNTPVEGAYVSLYPGVKNPTNSSGIVPGVVTDADGKYTLGGLAPGSYIVSASKEGYAVQYFDQATDPANATKVHVTDGNTTTGIDFALAGLPAITGTVRSSAATPIPYAYIFATTVPHTNTQPIARYGTRAGQDGTYALALPGGVYKLEASAPGFLSEYYDNKRAYDSATAVTLNAAGPDVTGIDFSLGTGGIITGRVTNASDNSPLAASTVTVILHSSTDPSRPSNGGMSAVTDSNGVYNITGLPSGEYYVAAYHDGFSQLFYDGADDLAHATKVTVVEDQTTDQIDFALSRLPGISGRVVDATDNSPVAHAEIWIQSGNATTKPIMFAYTDRNGEFHAAVPAGTYKVRAAAMQYNAEWYNEKLDAATADAVVVPGSGTVSGIDFTLSRFGGAIGGIVTDGSSPVAGAAVKVWAVPDVTLPPQNTRRFFASTLTAADGSYELKGLPSGQYYVAAGGRGFLQEYYDDAATLQTATPVQVGTLPVGGINFVLAAGGSISGTVTSAKDNSPIAHAFVSVRGKTVAYEIGARTDSSGAYSIIGLPSGEYTVFAVAHGFDAQYYNNVIDPALATAVVVVAPANTNGIDFALATAAPAGTRFAGTVVSAADNSPVPLALVEAVHPQTGATRTTTTRIDGSFSFEAPEGSVLRARGIGFVGAYMYGNRDWSGVPGFTSPSEYTFELEPQQESGLAVLTGRVNDAYTGQALPNAWVFASNEEGVTWFGTTDQRGSFALNGLSDGSMNIMVSNVLYTPANGNTDVMAGAGNAEMSARRSNGTTGAETPVAIPDKITLSQNFPNPFNPSTTILFTLPTKGRVALRVYSLLGTEVATLVDGEKDAGSHTAVWHADTAPSGLYLYRLESQGTVITRRMTLMK